MVALYRPSFLQVETANGIPISGAKLHFYQSGTTTEITVYQDANLSTPHTNPVVADAAGIFPNIFVEETRYKTVLKDAEDVTILTTDPVLTGAALSGNEVYGTYIDVAAAEADSIPAGVMQLRTIFYDRTLPYGGAFYKRVASEPSHEAKLHTTDRYLPNGSTDASNGGWWVLDGDHIDVNMLGGDPTEAAYSTTAFNDGAVAAEALAIPLTAVGSYKVDDTITIRDCAVKMPDCVITGHTDNIILICGGSYNTANPDQSFGRVERQAGYATTNPEVRAAGVQNMSLRLRYANWFQLYADTAADVIASDFTSSYSTFHIDTAHTIELATNPANTAEVPDNPEFPDDYEGTYLQWITENTWYIKNVLHVLIDGTYPHNHNIFHTGTFEVGATITVNKGSSNIFKNVRFEGEATVTWGEDAWGNIIEQSWSTNQMSSYGDPSPTIVDNSDGSNIVKRTNQVFQERLPVVAVNKNTCRTFTDNAGSSFGRGPNFTTLENIDLQLYGMDRFYRAAFGLVFDSPKLLVEKGDGFEFWASHARFRIYIRPYDSSGVAMTETTHADIAEWVTSFSDIAWDNSSDAFISTAEAATYIFYVNHSNIAYVEVDIVAGSAGVGDLPFDEFALHMITDKGWSPNKIAQITCQRPVNAAIAGSPTKGYAPYGHVVGDYSNGGVNTAVFSLQTTLNGAVITGSSTVVLTTVAGVTSGDIIGVELVNGGALWTVVNGAPVGSTVTLGTTMPNDANNGARIFVMRWA